jgi:site-specific DNA-methyltransferase (adenine-specific)
MANTSSKYQSSDAARKFCDFGGDNRDQRAYAYWCSLWLSECLRVCKPGSVACVFSDWRQPPTTDVFQSGGWVWRGIVPWNKTEAVRPALGRFRAQCEYVVWGSVGPMPFEGDVVPGFFTKNIPRRRENTRRRSPSRS